MIELSLKFSPASVDPVGNEFQHAEYLLYNPCDGYHIAFADFDGDEFCGFRNFLGTSHYERGTFYEAWAKLPDCNATLYPVFVRSTQAKDAS